MNEHDSERIAGLLEAAVKEPTPLQQELDRTGKRLTVVMLGICAVVFAAGLFSTSTLTLNVVLSLFLFAVALAVAADIVVAMGIAVAAHRADDHARLALAFERARRVALVRVAVPALVLRNAVHLRRARTG